MLRIEDPTDNGGRGWKRLTEDELHSLVYIALKLQRRGVRSDYAAKSAVLSDEGARIMARAICDRLKGYPTFGPERAVLGHSTGGSRQADSSPT